MDSHFLILSVSFHLTDSELRCWCSSKRDLSLLYSAAKTLLMAHTIATTEIQVKIAFGHLIIYGVTP